MTGWSSAGTEDPGTPGAGVRIDRASPARSVTIDAGEVRVATDSGSVSADAAIVTVPVAVLRAGTPQLALPDESGMPSPV